MLNYKIIKNKAKSNGMVKKSEVVVIRANRVTRNL
jgi:hypothetical protein